MLKVDLIKNRTVQNNRREPIKIFSLKMLSLIIKLFIYFIALLLSYVISFVLSIFVYIIYIFLGFMGYD